MVSGEEGPGCIVAGARSHGGVLNRDRSDGGEGERRGSACPGSG